MRQPLAAALLLGSLMTGCAFYAIPRYSPMPASVETLRRLAQQTGRTIAVAPVTAPEHLSPGSCRASGMIELPDGLSYPAYLHQALINELQMAGLYDVQSPLVMSHLEAMTFRSWPMPGATGALGDSYGPQITSL